MIPRRLRALTKLVFSRLSKGVSLYLRVIFCFAVGLAVLLVTTQGTYDSRLLIRGAQEVGDDIVLITLQKDDVMWMGGGELAFHSKNIMWSLKEVIETSDTFYWHPVLWEKAIARLKTAGAKSILVTLFFGEEAVRGSMTLNQQQLFHSKSVFWAAKSDPDGHVIVPGLSNSDNTNIGTVELRQDPDGKVRHFLSISNLISNMALESHRYVANSEGKPLVQSHFGELINFQGPPGTFRTFAFSDLISHRIPLQVFKGKTVIFGLSDVVSHQFQTPVGLMNTSEILANIIINFSKDKWITPIPFLLSTLFLLFALSLSLWIIFQYPQSVAMVFLSFLSLGILALATALFDLKSVWIPAEAAIAQILAAYVVISSYRLSESEKFSWVAEKELHYLSEVESLKNNFLSLISHDLKNPLAKIQGITDRLLAVKDLNLKPEIKEDLNNIMATSEELRQYITSILKLTSVESRNIKLTKEVCDINSIAEEVLTRLRPLARAKNITLLENLEPLFTMEFDRTLITEVLTNLIENAIKYSSPNTQVEIKTEEVGDDVKVQVSDHGSGIPEVEVARVFEKFYRGSTEKTLTNSGTGLGLYLVKYFIELHGGKVFINSRLGEGTTVGFTLPLEEAEESYADFTRSHR
jgi:two-component system phosphate regulon sensor histidine kinase PhoR